MYLCPISKIFPKPASVPGTMQLLGARGIEDTVISVLAGGVDLTKETKFCQKFIGTIH